jgi:peptidoglycan-associated lipoprotein
MFFQQLKTSLILASTCFFLTQCSSKKTDADTDDEAIPEIESDSEFTSDDSFSDDVSSGEGDFGDSAGGGFDSGATVAIESVTVSFDFDSSELSAIARMKLDEITTKLVSSPESGIQVTGHTDERGADDYNQALGMRRASSVKDYLMAGGLTDSQITTYSEGKRQPVIMGAMSPADHAQNRRAVIESSGSSSGALYSEPAAQTTTSEFETTGGFESDLGTDESFGSEDTFSSEPLY